MSAAAADRNWVDLPTDLLRSIAKLLAVADYIRFGAVCTSWGSAASPRDGCFPMAPQMPFLLLLGDEGERGESCTLVSLPDRRCRRIAPLPEMRGKWCVGSQDGWIALLDERSEVSFLNLLTRAQIHLPSVTTIPEVIPVYNSDDGSLSDYVYTGEEEGEGSIPLPEFRLISFKKIVLSSRPSAAGSYTAMGIFSVGNDPVFATEGGGKWTFVEGPLGITDIIHRDGKFLVVSYRGELWAFDDTGSSPPLMTMIAAGWGIECTGDDKYLVESSGDLLQVWRGVSNYDTDTIKVMKFDPEQAKWIPLKSLGDNSLFLGLNYSISLSAREISELKPNCIYATQIFWDWLSEDNKDKVRTRDVFVFNLEDASFDRYCPPDPRLNWPPPLWIAPSLL